MVIARGTIKTAVTPEIFCYDGPCFTSHGWIEYVDFCIPTAYYKTFGVQRQLPDGCWITGEDLDALDGSPFTDKDKAVAAARAAADAFVAIDQAM